MTDTQPTDSEVLRKVRDELRMIRQTVAAHGLATASHKSEASLLAGPRVLNRMVQNNP